MIRIAICDDEKPDSILIKSFITRYYSNSTSALVSVFDSSTDFLKTLDNATWDILFLDIEMTPPTGFELAKILHGYKNSPIIIFVTKNSKYVLNGYGLVFRYLIKPLQYNIFVEALDAAISEVRLNRLSFSYNNNLFSIPVSDILYIESHGHYSTIHTVTDNYKLRSTLPQIQELLPKCIFSSPHKSFLVNMQHILSASPSSLKLSSGELIPVSRRKRTDFNLALNAYLGR